MKAPDALTFPKARLGRVVNKVEAQMLMGQKLVRDVRSVVDVRIHAEGCRVHHDLERLHGVLVEVGVAVMESGFLTGHEKCSIANL